MSADRRRRAQGDDRVTPDRRRRARGRKAARTPKKLVLIVIDALKPAMLERAMSLVRAPAVA